MRKVLKATVVVAVLTLIFVVDDLLVLGLFQRMFGWQGSGWVAVLVVSAVLTANFVGAIVLFRFLKKRPVTGVEAMIGEHGVAMVALQPHQEGQVRVRGEIWRAVSEHSIAQGEKVVVTAVEGLTLHVAPLESQGGPDESSSPS